MANVIYSQSYVVKLVEVINAKNKNLSAVSRLTLQNNFDSHKNKVSQQIDVVLGKSLRYFY